MPDGPDIQNLFTTNYLSAGLVCVLVTLRLPAENEACEPESGQYCSD